jgi:hypothetical protein
MVSRLTEKEKQAEKEKERGGERVSRGATSSLDTVYNHTLQSNSKSTQYPTQDNDLLYYIRPAAAV